MDIHTIVIKLTAYQLANHLFKQLLSDFTGFFWTYSGSSNQRWYLHHFLSHL